VKVLVSTGPEVRPTPFAKGNQGVGSRVSATMLFVEA